MYQYIKINQLQLHKYITVVWCAGILPLSWSHYLGHNARLPQLCSFWIRSYSSLNTYIQAE